MSWRQSWLIKTLWPYIILIDLILQSKTGWEYSRSSLNFGRFTISTFRSITGKSGPEISILSISKPQGSSAKEVLALSCSVASWVENWKTTSRETGRWYTASNLVWPKVDCFKRSMTFRRMVFGSTFSRIPVLVLCSFATTQPDVLRGAERLRN